MLACVEKRFSAMQPVQGKGPPTGTTSPCGWSTARHSGSHQVAHSFRLDAIISPPWIAALAHTEKKQGTKLLLCQ